MKFIELAERVLREKQCALTIREIWYLAKRKGYHTQLNSKGKTPERTLSAIIYNDIKNNPQSLFAYTDRKPRKIYIKSQVNQINFSETPFSEELNIIGNVLERDLYSYLTFYAYHYLHCYTKTINHPEYSEQKKYKEWIEPDIVGCYFTFEQWEKAAYELCSFINNIPVRLLSFEIKRELNFENLRENFFQTVSNSSWANESYLVAADIPEEEEFRNELSQLSRSFGIGVIKLDIEDIHSSEIIFPAKYRKTLDWETINKLIEFNSDFKEFIVTIKNDITDRKVHKERYNQVPEFETFMI